MDQGKQTGFLKPRFSKLHLFLYQHLKWKRPTKTVDSPQKIVTTPLSRRSPWTVALLWALLSGRVQNNSSGPIFFYTFTRSTNPGHGPQNHFFAGPFQNLSPKPTSIFAHFSWQHLGTIGFLGTNQHGVTKKNSLFGKSFQLGGLEVGAPLRYFEKSQSVNRYWLDQMNHHAICYDNDTLKWK